MATFATCPDLHRHPSTRNAGLAAISFCANDNIDDELHGVAPATSCIFGQSQFLKSLSHPNLCECLDVIKGKRDRVFVVQEHYTNSLETIRNAQETSENKHTAHKGQGLAQIRSWAAQILDGLVYLNTHGIVHRALALSNVLLTEDGVVKLSNYGLYNMTKGGSLVQFSIGDPHYLSPITLGQGHTTGLKDYSVDLWSVGVILIEMYLGESFWRNDRLDLDEVIASLFAIRKLSVRNRNWIKECPESIGINPAALKFLQTGNKDPTRNQNEEGANGLNDEEQNFAAFLRDCLKLEPSACHEPTQLRNHVFFKPYDLLEEVKGAKGLKPIQWHQKPYIQSSFLPEYEGEVERLRQAISQEKSLSSIEATSENISKHELLCQLPLSHVFYLWKLAGGDVEAQFRRKGRLVGTPAIQLLPKVVQVTESKDDQQNNNNNARPPVRDIADLFSDVACVLPLENLEAEILKSIHEPNKDQFSWDTDYFLLSDADEMNFLQRTMGNEDRLDKSGKENVFLYPDSMRPPSKSKQAPASRLAAGGASGGMVAGITALGQQPVRTRVKVPLSIREKDLGYQYQRLSMFTDLLLQYPASRAEILHHSKIDIPPLLRGKVWAAILGVVGDYQEIYDGFDKYTEKTTDRQIELDVPRCHQYNQLMFSPAGHEKMKRLLKCWVEANENQVYWQDIFPLDKIYHLWDKILVGPSSLSLFVGIAILQQFRQELLRSEFNEAIGIFSDSFPEMDIEKCIETALSMCRVTPPSTCWLSYDQESREMRKQLSGGAKLDENSNSAGTIGETATGPSAEQINQGGRSSIDVQEKRLSTGVHNNSNLQHWWEEPLTIETMNAELAPRIHRSDFVKLRSQAMVIDIRPEADFRNGHYPLSIGMIPSQLDMLVHILEKLKKSYLVVIANRGDAGPEFASALVRFGFSRVALLMGGIDALRISDSPSTSTPNVVSPASPSLSSVNASTTTTAGNSMVTICSCRVLRQNITVQSKVKDDVVVHKCKTSFAQKKVRSNIAT
ncbi:hypothetical protein BGX27_011569 [Mortierella sp. AM989]|nr:hypothetical protein BGX27_011569 [Mortierella sp. AM989]